MAIKLPPTVRLLGKPSITMNGKFSRTRIINPGVGRHRIYVTLRKSDGKVESFRNLSKAIDFAVAEPCARCAKEAAPKPWEFCPDCGRGTKEERR